MNVDTVREMTVEPSSAVNIRLRFQAERMRLLDIYQAALIINASSAELIEASKYLCLKSTQLIAQAVAITCSHHDCPESGQVPDE